MEQRTIDTDAAQERARVVTEAWEAAWDRGDLALLTDLLAEDYRRISANNAEGESREEFLASIISTRAAFPDLTTVLDEVVVQDDTVAVRWHSTGTHTNSMLGVPPTNRTVTVSGATFAHFEGGRITTENVTWDPRALLAALGIISVG